MQIMLLLVECHNAFKGDGGRILPGNKEVFELMDAVEKHQKIRRTIQP